MKDFYLLSKEDVLQNMDVTLQGHSGQRAVALLDANDWNIRHAAEAAKTEKEKANAAK